MFQATWKKLLAIGFVALIVLVAAQSDVQAWWGYGGCCGGYGYRVGYSWGGCGCSTCGCSSCGSCSTCATSFYAPACSSCGYASYYAPTYYSAAYAPAYYTAAYAPAYYTASYTPACSSCQ